MDVQGWITLTNSSGTPYVNAKTLLVPARSARTASATARYPPPPPPPRDLRQAGTETAGRERLGDFYLYPLPERTTIANAQTKQVSFLDVAGSPAARAYEYPQRLARHPRPAAPAPISVLRFSSSRAGGLGDALPAGTVRVYQRDARGAPQFVGESAIGHTPMGSRARARHRPGIRHQGPADGREARARVERRQPLAHDDALQSDQRRPARRHRRSRPVGPVGRHADRRRKPQERAALGRRDRVARCRPGQWRGTSPRPSTRATRRRAGAAARNPACCCCRAAASAQSIVASPRRTRSP